jgi:hypothetical protein
VKLISLLLATTLAADAGPADPGGAAIQFLEKVRRGEINLEPGGDTALSARTAKGKQDLIARRINRIARDLGSDPLEVAAVKQDENFAAVLIRKNGGFDPGRMQVFPLALVKRDSEWAVAPVPASFENADTGYARAVRNRLVALENWMLREQVVDLQKLREQHQERMRNTIKASLTEAELREMTAEQTGRRFLTACESHDLPLILGLMGGLAAQPPDDWSARLKAADRAINAADEAPRPWRLLTAPEVARVLVHSEEDPNSALISFGCIDAAKSPARSVDMIHIELSKSAEGLWQINPPPGFFQDIEEQSEDHEDSLDSDLVNNFPRKWMESHPPRPGPSPEAIHQALVEALRVGTLPSLLSRSKLDGDPANAVKACLAAGELWWSIREPSAARHLIPLDFKVEENLAAGLFQIVSLKEPDRFAPQWVFFEQSDSGWLWTPAPSELAREKFETWGKTAVERWADEWQEHLMEGSIVLDKRLPGAAPAEQDAKAAVEKWLELIRQGNVEAALQLSARLAEPNKPVTPLQNLGYEIIGARKGNNPRITRIYRGDVWAAVGVKQQQDGKPSHPLYPVIQTAAGPRILVECELFAAGNRGRDFLNKTAFQRLEKLTSPAVANDLRRLFADYEADIAEMSVKTRKSDES